MTVTELITALADRSVREEVQRLLGLPSDRVADRLEALVLAQAKTDQTVKELAAEVKELAAAQAKTDQTVKELAAEVTALAAAQARTDQTVKELAAEVKELSSAVKALAAAQARTDQAVRETRQALAKLSDNVGFGLEELAAIVLPDVLQEKRRVRVSGFERRFITTSAGEEELDLFADGDRDGEAVAVIGEVKSRIYRADVERFARRVRRLEAQLDRPVVSVMFGFVVHPSAAQGASETGVLVVASRPSSLAA